MAHEADADMCNREHLRLDRWARQATYIAEAAPCKRPQPGQIPNLFVEARLEVASYLQEHPIPQQQSQCCIAGIRCKGNDDHELLHLLLEPGEAIDVEVAFGLILDDFSNQGRQACQHASHQASAAVANTHPPALRVLFESPERKQNEHDPVDDRPYVIIDLDCPQATVLVDQSQVHDLAYDERVCTERNP